LSTKNQSLFSIREKKRTRNRSSLLKKYPQLKGVVTRFRLATPKKPNSARRPVAHVVFFKYKRKKKRVCHIPGGGHTIRKHSEVLICGNGVRDLPGVNYTCMRGVYDFLGNYNKTKRRSIYGVKFSVTGKRKPKLRRKFRVLLKKK
jgi:small subunit ribosomal protein S12